jgi:hypothetical protein
MVLTGTTIDIIPPVARGTAAIDEPVSPPPTVVVSPAFTNPAPATSTGA